MDRDVKEALEAFKTEVCVSNEVLRIEMQQAMKEYKSQMLDYLRLEILAAHFHMDSEHDHD